MVLMQLWLAKGKIKHCKWSSKVTSHFFLHQPTLTTFCKSKNTIPAHKVPEAKKFIYTQLSFLLRSTSFEKGSFQRKDCPVARSQIHLNISIYLYIHIHIHLNDSIQTSRQTRNIQTQAVTLQSEKQ